MQTLNGIINQKETFIRSLGPAQETDGRARISIQGFFRQEFEHRCAILDAILRKQRGRLAVASHCLSECLAIFGETPARLTAEELELAADTIDFRQAFGLFEKLETEIQSLIRHSGN